MEPLRQFAALPFVEAPEGVLVALVSSRGTGRWVLPKGWPKADLSGSELAELEAFEEAGLAGEIAAQPIGTFRYATRLHVLAWVTCEVAVFPLRVTQQHRRWPEQASRRLRWLAPDEAAGLVQERELQVLLRAFAPTAVRFSSASAQ